jgi:adenosylcobinamide-GDP ribazoletransferase
MNEIRVFFTALMFFTRVPCPKWIGLSDDLLNKATKYLPLVGIIVGSGSALVLWLSHFVFPAELSIIASMIVSILITGAFHEDGFADVCDGFGGGWSKQQILDIMKDSRIGAFGTIGIVLILLTKYFALHSIDLNILPFVLIAGHTSSRFAAVTFIFSHEYTRTDNTGKSKPIGSSISKGGLLFAFVISLLPFVLLKNPLFLLIFVPVLLAKWSLARYFKKWIGGYTGDCLGATQQICEIVFYLSFIILWRFI